MVITMAARHIRHIERAGTRRIRKMTQEAVSEACEKGRQQGARPISAVDDLTMAMVGPWVGTFAKCLARSALREGISIVGGEMAQMPDIYKPGYVGVVVSVVSLAAHLTGETKP